MLFPLESGQCDANTRSGNHGDALSQLACCSDAVAGAPSSEHGRRPMGTSSPRSAVGSSRSAAVPVFQWLHFVVDRADDGVDAFRNLGVKNVTVPSLCAMTWHHPRSFGWPRRASNAGTAIANVCVQSGQDGPVLPGRCRWKIPTVVALSLQLRW